ncbi:MAG: tRNA 2-thiouridine(34) synthase MnmA [Ignavibacteriaceae bacterium]|nr:tRNA 2-thiouridine(34) synthase MnmA [Ignavibacteriaceae bacterium]
MKTAVLLSGGVDSSVALSILKGKGHDLTAFYLKIWLQDEFTSLGDCPWEEDIKYATAVCKQLDVPFEVVTMQNEYWDSIVSYTIAEVKSGRTPNPDVFCNSMIKFGKFFDKIDDSFEKVASGHYALTEKAGGNYRLKISPDPVKDQTYFLSYLKQKQLKRALFPLGDFNKNEVRKIANSLKLANMERKDSQGICFLGQIKFKDFVKFHLGTLKGDIINADTGKKMGIHDGFYFYTIGQRSGLGLSGGPWYVTAKDQANNIVYISDTKTEEAILKTDFEVAGINWIDYVPSNLERLRVKLRHGKQFINCTIQYLDNGNAIVKLEKGDRGIAPGQFAVFYDDKYCLGGSVIV